MAVARRRTHRPKRRQIWPAGIALVPVIRVLGGIALLGTLVLAHHYLSRPEVLPLRVIEVDGEFRHLETEQIRKTVVATINGGFFSCEMGRLRAAVLRLPWVADVSIRRVWPDRLRMAVTEEVPLARWGDDALINADARVFRPGQVADYGLLARLSGPAGSEARVVAFYQAALPAAKMRDLSIRTVQLDQRRHWWIGFEGDLTLSLGRDEVAARLAQFFRVYPTLVAQPHRLPERVDMRYAHGFAVRWRSTDQTEMKTTTQEARDNA